jgi:voltage-gated potassium channel
VTGWKRWAWLSAVLGIVLVLYFTVPVSFDLEAGGAVEVIVSLVALALLAVAVLAEVRRQLVDADRRIDGLVVAVMIAVLGFALGFYVLAQRDPDQIAGLHTRVDALYFTMSTLLTIGYGDVHAAGQAARVLVLIQMIFNVVIVATAASTITTRVRSRAAERAELLRTAETPAPRRRYRRRTHRNPT